MKVAQSLFWHFSMASAFKQKTIFHLQDLAAIYELNETYVDFLDSMTGDSWVRISEPLFVKHVRVFADCPNPSKFHVQHTPVKGQNSCLWFGLVSMCQI